VVGEISGFNKSKHRRIVGFQLVELDDDGRKQAEVAATLFDTERKLIERGLRRAGNPFRLEDEVRVRLKVRVELYVPWGSYRVIVEDIDVKYTLGDAARRREEILRRLSEQGLVGVNSALPMPTLPLSVGLITSLGSDAYNDVMRTLQESGYAFRVAVHGARVQGRQTESSVLNALDWFRDRKDTFDVVMICRGGGSRTDLAWFDSEPLGRAVACFPVPVVIGIGHEQDHSVLDAVARRAKTPTAAAGVIVGAVAQTELATEQLGRGIVDEATERIAKQQVDSVERGRRLVFATRSLLLREQDHLQGQRQRAVRASRGLVSAARQALSRAEAAIPRAAALLLGRRAQDLGALLRSLVHSARRDLSAARLRVTRSGELLPPRVERLLERRTEQLGTREHRLGLVDPRRVLERGYSILRNADGGVVTAADQALAGTQLRAELRHGTLRLKSEGPAEDPDKD
jgi:exodeoxyribonuclease VII large subunit